ncbi:unnamed protein product [Rodentolepis nana]|uniref:Uncharacterized protein n=1 Tax=Rodentolepis nana TaxID=102285 RepID=A0A3P7VA29_RODNA|nr:unnamed protein product [Rodentolepis nana]
MSFTKPYDLYSQSPCLSGKFSTRLKYYFGWCLAEMLGICAGNGYTGIDPETHSTLWLNVHNFDFFQVETAPNLKLLIDAWNIGTVRWLREVVYLRAPLKFRTVFVFLVSAFWHGLYPGYYLMFLSFALFTHTSRAWRRNFRPLVLSADSATVQCIYDIFTLVVTHFVMEYAQAPFHLLSFFPSIKVWLKFYFRMASKRPQKSSSNGRSRVVSSESERAQPLVANHECCD